MKHLLNNKNSLLLWISRTFSRFGDALEMLAMLYLIYDITGSGLAMGGLMLFSVLPNAVVSPLAGVIADKYSKKRIMFIAEMVRTICMLGIAVLMLTKAITLWQIYLISFILSVAESFFEPTAAVTFTLVVGKEDMPIFNSVVTISNHIARVVGYSLSGMLIVTIGKAPIFIIDAITFFVSGIIAIIITIPKLENLNEKKSSFKDTLFSGFKYVFTNKTLVAICFVIMMIQFLGTPLDTYVPIIINKVLKTSKVWSGYFATATIVGAILGNVLYPILNKTAIKLYQVYLVGINVLGFFIGLSAYFINSIYYLIMFFMVGLITSVIGTWSFTEVQVRSDPEYLGRVVSILTMIMLISSPLAGVIFGGLADKIYIPTIFKFLTLAWIVVSIIAYIFTKNVSDKIDEKAPSTVLE